MNPARLYCYFMALMAAQCVWAKAPTELGQKLALIENARQADTLREETEKRYLELLDQQTDPVDRKLVLWELLKLFGYEYHLASSPWLPRSPDSSPLPRSPNEIIRYGRELLRLSPATDEAFELHLVIANAISERNELTRQSHEDLAAHRIALLRIAIKEMGGFNSPEDLLKLYAEVDDGNYPRDAKAIEAKKEAQLRHYLESREKHIRLSAFLEYRRIICVGMWNALRTEDAIRAVVEQTVPDKTEADALIKLILTAKPR